MFNASIYETNSFLLLLMLFPHQIFFFFFLEVNKTVKKTTTHSLCYLETVKPSVLKNYRNIKLKLYF